MKKLCFSLSIVVAAILLAMSVRAFDGNRKGFVLGGGGGLGYATFQHKDCISCERASSLGPQTVLIVGSGLTENLILSYTGLQFWTLDFSPSESKVAYVLLPSIELRYFQSKTAPSIFYSAGLGYSAYDDTNGDLEIADGATPHFGIGREFAGHWSLEVRVAYTIDPRGYHKSMLGAMFLVTALAY